MTRFRSRACRIGFVLLLVFGREAVAASAVVASAVVDSAATASAADGSVRGTRGPLAHPVSPLRIAARGVLAVPWAAFSLASWPVEGLAQANEEHHLVQRAVSVITFRIGTYRTRVGPLFGYASSTGLSPLGATVRNDDWFGTGSRLRTWGGWLSDRDNTLGMRVDRDIGPADLRLLGEGRWTSDLPFYGTGPRSPDERQGADRRHRLLEADVALRVAPGLTLAGATWIRDQESLSPENGAASVTDAFPELADRARRARYTGVESRVTLDTRDRGPFSTRGGLLGATAGIDRARTDGDGDYRHWSVVAQRFVDLWRASRVLALRARIAGLDREGDVPLPYSELESLGGKAGPRGYARHRYTDRSSLLLTAEYRYRVTERFEGRLFVDWGTVAPHVEDLRLADVDPTPGFGLAVPSEDFPLIFEIAFGPEDLELRVGTGSLFDEPSRRREP